MRLLILCLTACGQGGPGAPTQLSGVELFHVERGSAMVAVEGGELEMGALRLPEVDGFTPPPLAETPGHRGGPGHGRPGPGPRGPGPGPGQGGGENNQIRPMENPLPLKRVRVSSFFIDQTEVTRAQYAEFLEATSYRPPVVDEEWAEDGWNWEGTRFPRGTSDHPVVLVSWYDAREYCEWAGKRLPTEAEWQLAALGPAERGVFFPWGEEYDADALNHGRLAEPNFDDSDGYLHTSPVGAFPSGASPVGALDMFGNAWEWTADFRRDSWDEVLGERDGDIIVDPHTTPDGHYVAVRGGSYFFDLRPNPAGERNAFLPEIRRKTSGFRCAASTVEGL